MWLAADIAYLQAPAGDAAQVMMDAAWMVAPVLMARAAWRDPTFNGRGAGHLGRQRLGGVSSWSRSVL